MIRTLTVSALLAGVLLAGCSSMDSAAPGSPVAAQTLPGWVLVVPVEEEGRSVFVGGCTMALTAEEGIATALTDVRLQVTSAAGSQFTDIFNGSPKSSGITTTGIDRLDFRQMGLDLYPAAMEEGLSLERVYLRSCETGEVWESSGPFDVDASAGADIEGAVCSVFVRASLDSDAWERNLSETLREMRHAFRSHGRDNLAELADWIDGHLVDLLAGNDVSGEAAGARDR